MIKFTTFLLLLLLPLGTFAKTGKATPASIVKVEILHGEVATNFKLDGGSGTLEMQNTNSKTKLRKIDQEDFKFLLGLAQKLPRSNKLPKECYRARMQVTISEPGAKPIEGTSCFGMRSISAPQYQSFANLLAVSI